MQDMELNKVIIEERKTLWKKSRNRILLALLSLAVFFGIWELAVLLEWVDPRFVAAPSEVIAVMIRKFYDSTPDGGTLIEHISASMKLSLSGFLLAVVIGTPLGLLMGWYKPLDSFIKPVFNLVRPIPAVGWIPVMIVLLGIGTVSKASIIFLSAFVSIVINSYTGIKLTSQALINVSRTCGASNWYIFRHVGIPSAMPMIFTGWKVALGISWSTLVAAEMLASNEGLGYMILIGRQFMKTDLIICGMVVIGLIGIVLYALLNKLESVVLRWRRS